MPPFVLDFWAVPEHRPCCKKCHGKISQYACAVLLIVSSIALVAYQVVMIDDVSNGLLVYVAQAFLLVASIFGLDYYMKLITKKINGPHKTI